jgi:hypothetical protein
MMEILIPCAVGVVMYFMIVSRYRWISILGYLMALIFIMTVSFHLGYQAHICGPEPVKLWM